MKSIIPRLTIPALAALALVGCNPNNPSTSTNAQSTNSSVSYGNGISGRTTNMPATNASPRRDVNMTGAANDATR
jgi:hypothetical protein